MTPVLPEMSIPDPPRTNKRSRPQSEVDLAAGYAEAARARNTDRRITFQEADARELPFGDDFFDRAVSMFVLNFIPDAQRAVAEMRRVVRPGSMVTAVVGTLSAG